MVQTLIEIRKKIIEVALKNEQKLKAVQDTGIFYMPEIAFVYEVGLEIASQSSFLFASKQFKWIGEVMVSKESGRTDMLLQFNETSRVAIEFKFRSDKHKYLADIEKLAKVNEKDIEYSKIFCTLADVWSDELENDSRIVAVDDLEGKKVKKIGEHFVFPTHSWYNDKPIHCLVGVWEVL